MAKYDYFDDIQQEIRQASGAFEELEDDYRQAKRQLEELYHQVEDFNHYVRFENDTIYEELLSKTQQSSCELDQAFPESYWLFNKITDDNELFLRENFSILDESLDSLEKGYRKDYQKQTDEIDKLYTRLRLLDE